MQKWEYLELRCDFVYTELVPRFLNGDPIENYKKGPNMHGYIAKLGDEGWELTTSSILSGNAGTAYYLIFKRPKN